MTQSKADKMEADRQKRCAALLKEIGSATPIPKADDLKDKSSRWKDVNWTNVHLLQKIIASLALEDVPAKRTFLADGGKGDRDYLSKYVRFLFEDHATQKRKAKIALDREAKKARGGLDLRFEGLDQDARHAAWRREIWNGKEVTLSHEKFLARTGPEVGARAFWDALKAEQRAATRTKAEADGKVREMTREIKQPDAFKPGQDNEGAMPFGAGVDRLTGPWLIGDLKDKYIISVVEAAAKRRGVSLEDMGVDYARVLLITRRALEQKLRLVGMDNNARCVTTALTTGRDFILLGVEAAERALARLVAEMRVAAMANARDVVALGDRNRGEVLADGVACDDAPSVCFGAAAGGVLGGGVVARRAFRRVGSARRD